MDRFSSTIKKAENRQVGGLLLLERNIINASDFALHFVGLNPLNENIIIKLN